MVYFISLNDDSKHIINPKNFIFGKGKPFPWKNEENALKFLTLYLEKGYNVKLQCLPDDEFNSFFEKKKKQDIVIKNEIGQKLAPDLEYLDQEEIDRIHSMCKYCMNFCKLSTFVTLFNCPLYRKVS